MSSAGAAGADLRVVAPSPPGSGWDQLAQAMKTTLETGEDPRLVEVINVPGGSGAVGLTQFLASPGDADVLVTGLTMVDALLSRRTPVQLEQMTPVARLTMEYFAIAVPAKSSIAAIGDLKAALQTEPSKVTWAGGPAGGLDHAAASLLATATGLPPLVLNYVPFLTTGDAAEALTEGRVTAAFLPILELEPALKSGQLRLLAVAAPARLKQQDAVPTLQESGIDLDFANWRGLVAAPDSPAAQRERVTSMVALLAASPRWKELVASRGWEEAYLGPDAFADFVRTERARLKTALKAIGALKQDNDTR